MWRECVIDTRSTYNTPYIWLRSDKYVGKSTLIPSALLTLETRNSLAVPFTRTDLSALISPRMYKNVKPLGAAEPAEIYHITPYLFH